MPEGKIFIGTSGFSYDNWKGEFYPENLSKKDWLTYYAHKFNSLEINSSFYHLPRKKTFSNWARKTPEDFVFSIKASRYITHLKKLTDTKEPLKKLIDSAQELGPKLGPFLFQLPGNLKKDAEKLDNLLKAAQKMKIKSAFEFRDESWFDKEIYDILGHFGSGVVISSSPKFPYHEKITGNLCYIRLHGKEKLYHSSYSRQELEEIAAVAKNCRKKGIDTFIYFNNDALGHAFRNAMTLQELVS